MYPREEYKAEDFDNIWSWLQPDRLRGACVRYMGHSLDLRTDDKSTEY